MIKSTVSGIAAVKKALSDIVKNLDAPMVTVGIHEDAADPPEGEINMATLGAIQDLGNENIPARPWLEPGFHVGDEEYVSIMQNAVAQAIEDGKGMAQAMNQVGLLAVGNVQQFMTELKAPANAESTIKRKGSSNPLIDEGLMRSSVTYKIQQQKPQEGL